MQPVLTTRTQWNQKRPTLLVVACSDGRLQENLDEFLSQTLSVTHYDRFYVPGGGGALASSGMDHFRAALLLRECHFLLTRHAIENLFLIFHGPAEDGPEEALCVDYCRKLPWASAPEVRLQQQRDAEDVRQNLSGTGICIQAWRCEVGKKQVIQFVPLLDHSQSP